MGPQLYIVLDKKLCVMEKNGFTVLDVEPDAITVRLFAWKTGEPVDAIDRLAPYHTYTIRR